LTTDYSVGPPNFIHGPMKARTLTTAPATAVRACPRTTAAGVPWPPGRGSLLDFNPEELDQPGAAVLQGVRPEAAVDADPVPRPVELDPIVPGVPEYGELHGGIVRCHPDDVVAIAAGDRAVWEHQTSVEIPVRGEGQRQVVVAVAPQGAAHAVGV